MSADLETCYRHPDEQTRVHCTRCERPICPDCMHPAPVGHHCPTCVAEAGKGIRRARRVRMPRAMMPILLGANVVMFAVELLIGQGSAGSLITLGAMVPELVAGGQYWRLVTAMFLHVGVLHLVLNMYVLYLFGGALESALGSVRLTAIYFVTGLWASTASFVLGGPGRVAVGASGAIFGLLGAWLAYNVRRRRLSSAQGNIRAALLFIGLNLVLGVVVPGIDNAAHLGGLAAGLVAGPLAEGFGRRRLRLATAIIGLTLFTLGAAAVVAVGATRLAA